MKQILLLKHGKMVLSVLCLLMAWMPGLSWADEVIDNGVKYKVENGEAKVVGFTDELPEEVVLPEKIQDTPVTTIEKNALYGSKMTKITFPATVTYIGSKSCYGPNLAVVRMLAEAPVSASTNSFNIRRTSFEIQVPKGCVEAYKKRWTVYAKYIVEYTTAKEVCLGGLKYSVDNGEATLIGLDENTTSDGNFEVPEEVEGNKVVAVADKAFQDVKGISSISLPASLKAIGSWAFAAYSLQSVTFRDAENSQLEKNGDHAFYNAMIREIVLPASLKEIGDYAFFAMKLSTVDVMGTEPASLGEEVFYTRNFFFAINVPAGTGDAYKASWTSVAGKIVEKATDAISLINVSNASASFVYTLNGCKVADSVKGLHGVYIVNGTKVIFK